MTAKILVVDDDIAFRRLTSHRLQAAGYEVAEACDAGAAEQLFAAGAPELLLVDLHLGPGKRHGYSLARSAQVRHPAIKVVFMTGGDPSAYSLQSTTDILLQKPFSAEELLRTIAAVL